MHENLPPLDHLRAFEAAARHLSFKEAASEMNVTPAAVGQRIRSLETMLRCKLFTRHIRQIALTQEGQLLLEDVAAAIGLVKNGLMRHWARQQNNVLRVSTTNSFTELSLLPRLPEFTSLFPDEDVRIISTDEKLDPVKYEADVCIRLGRTGELPGCEVISLGKQFHMPVCSPVLLQKHPELATPDDILDLPLIEEEWSVQRAAAPSWQNWLASRNVKFIPKCPMIKVSLEAHAVRAAVQGQGVTLARSGSITERINDGSLVEIFQPTGRDEAKFEYHLVWRKDEQNELVTAFVDWARADLVQMASIAERGEMVVQI